MTTRRLIRPTVTARGRGWLLCAVASAACSLPANPRHPKLFTFTDLAALADPTAPDATFADDAGVPGGLRVREYVTVNPTDGTRHDLTMRNTWTEGYRSAYVTAEVWTGFDEVWVQPVYVPITGFDPATGAPLKLVDKDKGAWSPIFSVGSGSAFYSPFWQVFYFQVPSGTEAEAYTTARKVIDSGLPLVPGPARTMSLVPKDERIGLPKTATGSIQLVGGPQAVSQGYLDGQDIGFLDFGAGKFTWDDDQVVDETPLFVLVHRTADGTLEQLHAPTVAGTGPLYANRPARVTPDGVPLYGAYWRLYTVEVPPTARIFGPSAVFSASDLADFPPSLLATDYGASVTAAGKEDVSQWFGRVALNAVASADATVASCFDSYDKLDTRGGLVEGHCDWLDSQPAIEASIPPSAIEKTDILVTCPFVSYHDLAVTP